MLGNSSELSSFIESLPTSPTVITDKRKLKTQDRFEVFPTFIETENYYVQSQQ